MIMKKIFSIMLLFLGLGIFHIPQAEAQNVTPSDVYEALTKNEIDLALDRLKKIQWKNFDINQKYERRINDKITIYETLLHRASAIGASQVVKFLLEHNADVDARESDQWTPLHLAAQNGHLDVAQLLLAHNADVDARDPNQWTPLHLAAYQGHLDVAQLLLAHNADEDARESEH